MRGAEALARLYSARLFVNVFQPSFKLAEKTRVGARVHKRYHAPATPCARLLASNAASGYRSLSTSSPTPAPPNGYPRTSMVHGRCSRCGAVLFRLWGTRWERNPA